MRPLDVVRKVIECDNGRDARGYRARVGVAPEARDGAVWCLDFGCVKEIPEAMCADMRRYVATAIRATRTEAPADWAAFLRDHPPSL